MTDLPATDLPTTDLPTTDRAAIARLRRRPDFLAAADGRRFHTERLTAQGRVREACETRDGESIAGLHLGFTITKRVGHATERNRIRRRLRAAVAELGPEFGAVAADVVLIARRPAIDAAFDTLKDDLRRAIPAVAKPRGPSERARPSRSGKPGSAKGRGKGPAPSREATPQRSDRAAAPARAPSATSNACDGGPDGQ
ncbi:ribonuclease P protein component [Methylobacterium sp. WL6]|uniref:ribonuclease P protein component n=1 Tax=Methylobacterium sp. WL6 TaxID=2603901 RepID=UPI0011CAEDF0|nr:ribonuclease P protein component [Methylobacterium sp. WL6]TXN69360.1 ribonuclease P protein component [Methylobacterium sp. WL6]